MADYLLDTNYLLYLIDPNADKEKKKEVLLAFSKKLQDNDNQFFLTSLIRYEVLRGVKWEDNEKLSQLEQALTSFKTLDITDSTADLASELYRFDEFQSRKNNMTRNLEKRKFDIFHFATAKINNLEILSKDTDIEKIEKLFTEYQKNIIKKKNRFKK